MRFIVCVLLILLFSVESSADCRKVVRVKEVVAVEKVAAIAVPVVAVQVPFYASYYQPPAPAPNAAGVADNGELTNAVKTLVEQMKSFNERLDRLERGGGGVQPMPPAEKPGKPSDPFNPQGAAPLQTDDVAKLFAARCAACHQQGREGKGGGFVLLGIDGKITAAATAKAGKIAAKVYIGEMPPKGQPPVKDEEVATIMSWLATASR